MEPLIDPKNRRFCLFPIKYQDLYQCYQTQLKQFWVPEEIDISHDYQDFEQLNEHEQYTIKMVLAFFSCSDAIVNLNTSSLLNHITIQEAIITYQYQQMMENIHQQVYSLMLDNIIKDENERDKLFNAFENIPIINKISQWALKWIDDSQPLANRIIAYACVEGVLFSACFAVIFHFKQIHKNKMKAFIKMNEFICRDESEHLNFALKLYTLIQNKPEMKEIQNIIHESVLLGLEFATETLQVSHVGLNKELLQQYVQFVADRLYFSLTGKKMYNVTNPLKYMEFIGIQSKTNFFEQRNSEYNNPYSNHNNYDLTINYDF